MVSKFCVLFIVFISTFSYTSYGQSYGLEFAGHEVVQDRRTGLSLSGDQKLCLKSFQFEFDLSFMPGRKDYFGYIFRIIDGEKRNIDLVYDMRFAENRHFKLVMGDKVSDISFDIDVNKLFKKWYQLRFSFDIEKQQLRLLVDGKEYKQKVKLNKGCYNFFFGASSFEGLTIKDVPPMKIKDVFIKENGVVKYDWPLDEKVGLKAKERHEGNDGVVANPIWIKKKHFSWELVNQFSVGGAASIGFNPSKEDVYVVGEDSISMVNVLSHKVSNLAYRNGKQHLLRGNQSFFDSHKSQLYNLFIDQKLVSAFDFKKSTWTRPYDNTGLVTDYIHANKFYSAVDSSIYMFGGYGQYTYRRSINRWNVSDGKWTTVEAKGDFTPRYLAALGQVKEGAYILGGYGSTTGEQILKPRNIYDLNFYDLKKRTFRKVFQLTPKSEEFAFANSMVIDEKTGIYYALTFPNSTYKSSLQLIKGSLTSSEYQLVGSAIPYDFHDVDSFADLFYSPAGKKYIAVTLLYDVNKHTSLVKIYTLLSPPEVVTPSEQAFTSRLLILLVIGGLAATLIAYLINRAIQVKRHRLQTEGAGQISTRQSESPVTIGLATPDENPVNAIFAFGNLQLYDRDGGDVTKHFSPLMRELFLMIFVYTLTRRKGISSEKLYDILWFDKSVESARNNRSVNIAKLRAVIEKIDGCHISNESGNWTIDFDEDRVAVDYIKYQKIMKNSRQIDGQGIQDLTRILSRGSFLSNVEYDWLDSFKSEISNEIIDAYLNHANSPAYQHPPIMLIKLSDQILSLDTMNEEAIAIKCKAWVKMGKHTLARSMFDMFKKEFKILYGEEYKRTFREIVV